MREKLATLPLTQLKELAKSQGIRNISGLRKAELIDRLCEAAESAGGAKVPAENNENRENTAAPMQAAAQKEKAPAAGNVSGGAGQEKMASERPAVFQDRTGRPERTERAERYERNDRQERGERQMRNDRQGSYQSRQNNYRDRQSNYQDRQSSYQDRQSGHQDRQISYQDRQSSYQDRQNAYQGQSSAQDSQTQGSYQDRQTQGGMPDTQGIQESSRTYQTGCQTRNQGAQSYTAEPKADLQDLDSGIEANGILEVMPDGFGFIRCENFLPGDNDVYVAPSQIRRFNMKTGDIIRGSRRVKSATEKFAALLYVKTINGYPTSVVEHRPNFEDLTPIFPNQRLNLEVRGGKNTTAMRVMDLLAPIGKGQRGLIVSPPKAGKTTLLKQVAKAVTTNYPDMHMIILLIDERPEEVTDIKESVVGPNVEVIYSTFDELPERHKRVSEMVIERARRLVEHGRDVMILLDSITRLARAYNLVVPPSGRTLSGGLDPAALHMPKRFFGAARNMREGGSLTILATALVDTGSKMDDVVYEEFKGTGNMELVLNRKLQEKRIFPAIDIAKSGTRREDLLLSKEELEAVDIMRKALNGMKSDEALENILNMFAHTKDNKEFVQTVKKQRFLY